MKTKQTYADLVGALYYFHCMINGTIMTESGGSYDGNKYAKIIQNLISNALNERKNNYDKYTNDTFTVFTRNQHQITLDLYQINSYFGAMKHVILDSIFYDTTIRIRGNIFKLFQNMKELIIYSKPEDNADDEMINKQPQILIDALLKSVEANAKHKELFIIIETKTDKYGISWLSRQYEKMADDINGKFDKFELYLNEYQYEDQLTINYKHD